MKLQKLHSPLLLLIFFILTIIQVSSILSPNPNLPSILTKNKPILHKSIYVDKGKNGYFFYQISSLDGKLQISILDHQMKVTKLTFKKNNQVVFRDAYKNFVVVEEKRVNLSICYWVLSITRTNQGFSLQSLAVNSHLASHQQKPLHNSSILTITELQQTHHLLYISLDSSATFSTYAINLRQKFNNRMKLINSVNYTKGHKQNFIGGNSRVLVQTTNCQIWVDCQVEGNSGEKEENNGNGFEKMSVEGVKDVKFFGCGSRVYKLAGSFFQYVSVSQDQKSMSTFVYHGYDKSPVQGLTSLNSSTSPLRFLSDNHTFFACVSDTDVYYSLALWNDTTRDYTVHSNTIQNTIKDQKKWSEYVKCFKEALIMVVRGGRFHVLTCEWFVVMGENRFDRVRLGEEITDLTDLKGLLMGYMRDYYRTMGKRVAGYLQNDAQQPLGPVIIRHKAE